MVHCLFAGARGAERSSRGEGLGFVCRRASEAPLQTRVEAHTSKQALVWRLGCCVKFGLGGLVTDNRAQNHPNISLPVSYPNLQDNPPLSLWHEILTSLTVAPPHRLPSDPAQSHAEPFPRDNPPGQVTKGQLSKLRSNSRMRERKARRRA